MNTKEPKFAMMPPSELTENPWNTNHLDKINMDKLVKSILKLGFFTAIVVRETEYGFEIIGGAHRKRAAIILNLETVPVISLGHVSDEQAKVMSLADNARYGNDDATELANLLQDMDAASLSEILPIDEYDIEKILSVNEINIEDIDTITDFDFDNYEKEEKKETKKEYDTITFSLIPNDAEMIKQKIQKYINSTPFSNKKPSIAAGEALMSWFAKDL